MQARVALGGIVALIVLGAGAYFFAIHDAVRMQHPLETPMPAEQAPVSSMTLAIPAFSNGGTIPAEYTCDGAGGSPALEWGGVPEGAKSLVLIAEDPDVPKALKPDGLFVHWVVYGIPPQATGIPAGGAVGSMGENSAGQAAYAPACPPKQYEPSEHRYIFTLYALDIDAPQFIKAPSKDELLQAIEGHVIAKATYTGRYQRP